MLISKFPPAAIIGTLALLAFMALMVLHIQKKYIVSYIIRSSGTIILSGSYRLENDIIGTDSIAIKVRGDDVEIDLNGKSISCTPTDEGNTPTIGIHILNKGTAKIFNGSIHGCDIGIQSGNIKSLTIKAVDFSRVAYMGVSSDADRAYISASTFAEISGYNLGAYAIGIRIFSLNECRIENNTFSEIYRQKNATLSDVGEGVGVIISAGTKNCFLTDNVFINKVQLPGTIGVWVGVNGAVTLADNRFDGFEMGVSGGGKISANDNTLRLFPPGGNDSYGLYGGPDSAYSGNLISGYNINQSIVDRDGVFHIVE